MTAIDLLAVVGIVSVPVSIGLAVAWHGARREVRLLVELMRETRASARGLDAADVARLERAVETIAVEVERVSEGQRYVTRLLADRAPAERPALPHQVPPPRVITPH
jgi:hypothetical protein